VLSPIYFHYVTEDVLMLVLKMFLFELYYNIMRIWGLLMMRYANLRWNWHHLCYFLCSTYHLWIT